jgi:phage gp29-like protein
MSLVIRGQTLTSRGGDQGSGSMALGEVHERQGNLVTEADAKMLMEAVQQQVVDPLTVLNFGPDTEAPEFIIEYEEGEDLDKRVDRDVKLSKMVEIPKSYIRETYQLPEPGAGEEVVEAVDPLIGLSVDPNAERDSNNGARGMKKRGATNLAEPGSTDQPINRSTDEGDPEPQVIEREALRKARGIYGQFISGLFERAMKEIPE